MFPRTVCFGFPWQHSEIRVEHSERFVERSSILNEASEYLQGDTLTIIVEGTLEVWGESSSWSGIPHWTPERAAYYFPVEQRGHVLEVYLRIDSVHAKFLIENSGYFRREWGATMLENPEKCVLLPNEELPAFLCMLAYIETNVLVLCEATAFDLYKMARKYEIPVLLKESTKYIKHIPSKSISDILKFASFFNDVSLTNEVEISVFGFVKNYVCHTGRNYIQETKDRDPDFRSESLWKDYFVCDTCPYPSSFINTRLDFVKYLYSFSRKLITTHPYLSEEDYFNCWLPERIADTFVMTGQGLNLYVVKYSQTFRILTRHFVDNAVVKEEERKSAEERIPFMECNRIGTEHERSRRKFLRCSIENRQSMNYSASQRNCMYYRKMKKKLKTYLKSEHEIMQSIIPEQNEFFIRGEYLPAFLCTLCFYDTDILVLHEVTIFDLYKFANKYNIDRLFEFRNNISEIPSKLASQILEFAILFGDAELQRAVKSDLKTFCLETRDGDQNFEIALDFNNSFVSDTRKHFEETKDSNPDFDNKRNRDYYFVRDYYPVSNDFIKTKWDFLKYIVNLWEDLQNITGTNSVIPRWNSMSNVYDFEITETANCLQVYLGKDSAHTYFLMLHSKEFATKWDDRLGPEKPFPLTNEELPAFLCMLCFIETKILILYEATIFDVYKIAQEYDIPILLEECRKYIEKFVLKTASVFIEMAKRFNSDQLTATVKSYVDGIFPNLRLNFAEMNEFDDYFLRDSWCNVSNYVINTTTDFLKYLENLWKEIKKVTQNSYVIESWEPEKNLCNFVIRESSEGLKVYLVKVEHAPFLMQHSREFQFMWGCPKRESLTYPSLVINKEIPAFLCMLYFIETKRLILYKTNIVDLYKIACKYHVPVLLEECMKQILRKTLSDISEFARFYNDRDLRIFSTEYFNNPDDKIEAHLKNYSICDTDPIYSSLIKTKKDFEEYVSNLWKRCEAVHETNSKDISHTLTSEMTTENESFDFYR